MKPVVQITLIIAECCNLACQYCYENHKENSFMSFSTAKKIIDKEMQSIQPDGNVQIEFFGGEPFLNFDLIRQVVDYVDEYYPGKAEYNTTTNGTILNKDVKEWLRLHSHHFFASLSLDGTQQMHDKNRIFRESGVGSYTKIDQEFFLDTWHPAKVKMTISPNILNFLSEGVIELLQKGFEVDATLALGTVDWSDGGNVEILIQQLQKLISFYKSNPQYPTIRMLDIPAESVFNAQSQYTRYCGAGKNIHCYTGNELDWVPCQGFSKITIGDSAKDYIGVDFEEYSEPEGICKSCKMTNLCQRCWGTNLAATGSIHTIDPWLCIVNRILILAGAKILYNRMIENVEFTDEYQRKLKAIQYILKESFSDQNVYLM